MYIVMRWQIEAFVRVKWPRVEALHGTLHIRHMAVSVKERIGLEFIRVPFFLCD